MHETQFLWALLTTLFVETALLFLVVRRLLRPPGSLPGNGTILSAGIIGSTATLPYVWFVLPAFIGSFRPYVLTAEVLVIVAEAAIFMIILQFGPGRALAVSALCNAASFVVGEIIKRAG